MRDACLKLEGWVTSVSIMFQLPVVAGSRCQVSPCLIDYIRGSALVAVRVLDSAGLFQEGKSRQSPNQE